MQFDMLDLIDYVKIIIFGVICSIVMYFIGFPAISGICLLITAGVLIIGMCLSTDFEIPTKIFISSLILILPTYVVDNYLPILKVQTFPIAIFCVGISLLLVIFQKFFLD